MAAALGLGRVQLGVHPLSRFGWEAERAAAWDVQSDGQLLQLVQAAAGARQVSLRPLARSRPRGWEQLRPEEHRLSLPGRAREMLSRLV